MICCNSSVQVRFIINTPCVKILGYDFVTKVVHTFKLSRIFLCKFNHNKHFHLCSCLALRLFYVKDFFAPLNALNLKL